MAMEWSMQSAYSVDAASTAASVVAVAVDYSCCC